MSWPRRRELLWLAVATVMVVFGPTSAGATNEDSIAMHDEESGVEYCQASWHEAAFGFSSRYLYKVLGVSQPWDGHAVAVGSASGAGYVANWRGSSDGRIVRGDGWFTSPRYIHGSAPGSRVTLKDAVPTESGIWAVGSESYGGTRHPLIARHTDGGWALEASRRGGAFESVSGFAKQWVAGWLGSGASHRALLKRWDGVSGSPRYIGQSGSVLWGVDVRSGSDVWAVGEDGAGWPLIVHWDGVQFRVSSGGDLVGHAGALLDVGVVRSEVFAVGWSRANHQRAPLAEYWDGSTWRIVPIEGVTRGSLSGVDVTGGAAVWAAGYLSGSAGMREPIVAYWTGREFQAISAPLGVGGGEFSAVSASASVLTAVGTATDRSPHVVQACPIYLERGHPRVAYDSLLHPGEEAVWSVPSREHQTHVVVDGVGGRLFASGELVPGASFSYRVAGAGQFPYRDGESEITGVISVPMCCGGQIGSAGTDFRLSWGIEGMTASDLVFDVQIRRPGDDPHFASWMHGTTEASGVFHSPEAGPKGTQHYWFRARIRVPTSAAASGWSEPLAITVVR